MRCVRVLQVGLSSYPGGVENAIMNYYRFLNKEKFCVDFVCTEKTLAYGEQIEKAGSKIYYLPSPKQCMLRFAKNLRRIINEGKYDIIHVNMLSAANIFPVLFAKGTCAKRVIAHAHNANLPGGIIKKAAHRVLKHLLPLLTKDWVACSPEAAKWLFGQKRVPNVFIMKNAIVYDRFQFDRAQRNEMRLKYAIGDSTPVIGHVGRFTEEKNHKFLLTVLTKLKPFLPDVKLLLVGDGPLREYIRQQAEEMGLAEHVVFIGGVNDAAPFYQMMDVFCLPSTSEGLGIVAIEAQASGLPCLCSTGVPQAALVSPSAKRIALEDLQGWEDGIIQSLNQLRNKNAETNINQAGYNVRLAVQNLETYYLN